MRRAKYSLTSPAEHLLHDGQRRLVGVAAALDEFRLQPGLGHGPADGRPSAVNHHRPHADRLHEDDVQQQVDHRPVVLHHAAPQLDHGDLAAKLADPPEGLDQYVGFLNRFFQQYVSPGRRKASKRRFPGRKRLRRENPPL